MELLYFSDISQLDYVLNTNSELLTHKRPITGDMVVSFELERLGIEFIDEWDFIEPTEIEENWNEAYALSTSWWEGLASTKYGAEALTKSVQQEMVYPFQTCLNARTVYGRLFQKFPIERIVGFFLPNVPIIRTGPAPTSRAVQSVSQAVLFYMSENRGIVIEKLSSSYPLSPGKKSGFGYGKPYISEVKHTETIESIEKQVVIVFKDGMRPDEFNHVMELLDNLPEAKPIVLSQSDIELGTRYLVSPSCVHSKLCSFWTKFIESNDHLRFQFDRIRSEMEQAANYGDVFAAFLDILTPSIIIFGHEAFAIERVLVGVSQMRGILTLGLLHGGVMAKAGIRGVSGISDQVLVWNNFDLDAISKYGTSMSNLVKVGSIQYEVSYLEYVKKMNLGPPICTKQAAKGKLGFDAKKSVIMLVTAEVNTGFAGALADPFKHRNALRELVLLVNARPDLQFVIKPHPSFDYYELYRRLVNAVRPNLRFLERATLEDVIAASDICLMINYCTTASLDDMLNQVPVVYLSNAVYSLNDWRDNLSATGIVRVDTFAELENVIDRLLINPLARQQTLFAADKQIREILGIEELPASTRFVNVIKSSLYGRQVELSQSLSSVKALSNFLQANDVNQTCRQISTISEMHSSETIMYVLAYLSGLNNLGYPSIIRLFELFSKVQTASNPITWRTGRWELMPAYIAGRLGCTESERIGVSTLAFIFLYLLHPQKFFQASRSVRLNLIRYLMKSLLGKRYFVVVQLVIAARNMKFNFSG
jgi:hypothetical protein